MNVRDQYEKLAPSYDERWRRYVADTLSVLTGSLELTGDEHILDVACGTGELARLLLEEHPGLSVAGVDISEKMLEVASEKLAARSNVRFEQGVAEDLPYGDDGFDLVVTASAFHYFDDPVEALREMRRVSKPGGRVVVLDWCKDFLACRVCDLALRVLDPAYRQCYGGRELRRMFYDANLEVSSQTRQRIGLVWGIMVVRGSPG